MASNHEIRQLDHPLSQLLNRQLQHICAAHGLKTGGVKAELQGRIKNALIENYTADPSAFNQLRISIQNTVSGRSPGVTAQPSMAGPSGGGYNYTPGKSSGYGQQQSYNNFSQPHAYGNTGIPSSSSNGYYKHSAPSRDLHFKASPFYSIHSRIGEIKTCDTMSQHRNSMPIPIKLNENPVLNKLVEDKSYRLMVFCSADNQGVQDIAFPHQSEIKVNGGEVKANLRGLKGKPGTTRPVDITGALRLKPINYNNNVEFTYALTTKVKNTDPSPTKFYLALYLCKMVYVDQLVAKIKGKKISKATVLSEMAKKANDPDVVATSTVLSLKCPLSYTRLRIPCRSTTCNHVQCFDANSYLQLQEQGPQWICPICNNPAPFDSLAIDDYVRDILENTSESLDQVTIEPNGQWKSQSDAQPRKSRISQMSASVDVDDDVSLVSDSHQYANGAVSGAGGFAGTSNAYSTPSRSFLGNDTTPGGSSSREPSGAPRSGANKRPAPEVIDLTFSSDEDDEPIARAPKRQNVGSGGAGIAPFYQPSPGSHY
ncbi:hypothetical protein F5Y16DRAFT_298428 [Xylariaceae sp. FL0255]|nr:hypothetical protein F5Y16DRAFT_298428 [Xylariaceae sp. FL0255]